MTRAGGVLFGLEGRRWKVWFRSRLSRERRSRDPSTKTNASDA